MKTFSHFNNNMVIVVCLMLTVTILFRSDKVIFYMYGEQKQYKSSYFRVKLKIIKFELYIEPDLYQT